MLHLHILGSRIDIDCGETDVRTPLGKNFSAFLVDNPVSEAPDLAYSVARDTAGLSLRRVAIENPYGWDGLDVPELIFLLEKEFTIELQKRRSELYFLHAAALCYRDEAFLLIGRSGNGKSTTCWGLLHHGCHYLSDELAPIELEHYRVQPYPHALCLKTEPPAPYRLPKDTLRTAATLHVAVEHLPCPAQLTDVPVRTIFHVEHRGIEQQPSLTRIRAAEAGMLVYANALNPLCHSRDGLDAALDIAQRCQTYRLTTGSLEASVAVIMEALKR